MLTTTKRCLNSKFAKKHLILNGKRFVATLLPDPINTSQDKKKGGGTKTKQKNMCFFHTLLNFLLHFYNYSPLCYPQR